MYNGIDPMILVMMSCDIKAASIFGLDADAWWSLRDRAVIGFAPALTSSERELYEQIRKISHAFQRDEVVIV